MIDRTAGAGLTDDARFRLLVNAVTDYAIYMLGPDGTIASWNPGAQRFKGYTADEIIGQNFARFYTEEDRATGFPQRALATAAAEGRFEAEGWRVRKDGSRFWAHVVIDPVRGDAGELLGYAKITRDLTERRASEQALRQSEERFRLLVQSVTDYAIYMLDPDGRVANWNQGAERIKGYRPDEIVGTHFSHFYSAEDRAAGLPQTGLETARREGRFEKEGWRIRKDGSRFWAHVVIDPVRDDDGEIIGYAKITRDITERMETQRALEQAREAFFQSQKMEAIGQLTGGVAHDFNNLLAAVIGSLELAKKRLADGADVTRFLDNAMKAAERGAALTQRMLSFARKQELKLEAVDVGTLVRGMADLLQRTLGNGIDIQTTFPLKLSPAKADAHQLELVLLNLAVNARDAMPDGGRIVIAADERVAAAGGPEALTGGRYVRLSVIDHGEGMDDATLARATEPFFTTKGVGKGTGLGLSMAHGLAEQSGGRLILSSRKGEGTRADLWLPVAVPDPETVAMPGEPVDRPGRTESLTILAVDDDGLVITNTAAMLEDLGHRALEASSARAALEILDRERVDLVITDYAMPQMTGGELIEVIAARWPELPVILATGYADIATDMTIAAPRLSKPFTVAQLAQAIAASVAARTGNGQIVRFPGRQAAS
jgi:PAS domain S-box-containing protein